MIKPLDVLVVEDEANTREIMEILLAELGHRVYASTNGREALNFCLDNGHPVDLILMDVHMPVMDGIEATKALRAHHLTAKIPIIGISAQAQRMVKENGLAAGFDAYLTKPLLHERVFEAVTATLRKLGRLERFETFS
jgi:CheY-like chemotaxis protein